MANWKYDSGGKEKHKDREKFEEGYDKIFESSWPCKECEGTRAKGHSSECSKHWKNK